MAHPLALIQLPRRLVAGLIRVYQLFFSPVLRQNCRFYPTCSNYALSALDGHGLLMGGLLAIKRLMRCHPWHPGGYDPVPDSPPSTSNNRSQY